MTVYLVGAGPGDPGLLTVRGAEVLRTADVVVYDRLSVASLLDLAPARAERIPVGKAPGRATMDQDDINALLVDRGKAGHAVVRLKGGDPFVFARGGEEAAALRDAGVDFEVVPGITSAIAVPAYAGIPVTLRHSSTSFTVVTGHEDPSVGDEGTVDWEAVARVGGTIVILMGVARIAAIAERLMAGGRSPDTPVASVQWGTRPEQRTIRATLGTIAAQPLEAPSTVVVGDVAGYDLSWFESRPLFGRRIVVTRAREQASALSQRLRALGAMVVEVPTIAIAEPEDGGAALRTAAASLAAGRYEWLVVTSANGAHRLLATLHDARDLGGVKVAAIGAGTEAALAAGNIRADLVPARSVGEALVEAFPTPSEEPNLGRLLSHEDNNRPRFDGTSAAGGDHRVLLARAAVARDVVPDGLRAKGWEVDVVDAYQTRAAEPDAAALDAVAAADVVTFTSASTVERFLDVARPDQVPPIVACIGPITAEAARARGLTVTVEATQHDIDGLIAAVVDACNR